MTDEDQTQDERAPEPDPAELLRARKRHLAAKLKARGLIKSDEADEPKGREGRSDVS